MSPTHPSHGTESGYSIHRQRRIPPCEPCKQAHADYNSARMTRIREQRRANGFVPKQHVGHRCNGCGLFFNPVDGCQRCVENRVDLFGGSWQPRNGIQVWVEDAA